jgi:hypothetical protein
MQVAEMKFSRPLAWYINEWAENKITVYMKISRSDNIAEVTVQAERYGVTMWIE